MARWRMCVVLLAALVVAALGGISSADAAAKPRKLKLLLPAPGHVTIDLTTTTVRRAATGRPRKLRIRARRAKALPPSVRVLWATRVIRRKRTITYATLMLAINKASRKASAAQSDGDLDPDVGGGIPSEYLLFFFNGGVEPDEWKAVNKPGHEAAVNATNVPRKKLTDLFEGVKNSFGDAFGLRPTNDPSLETGHYDDGHAFGWKPARQNDTWNALTTSLAAKRDMDEVVAQVESNLGVDIDADGDRGAPKCEQGNFTSPEREITVPTSGTPDTVIFDTPIPSALYYDRRNGYAGGGGCDRANKKMIANVDVLGGGTPVAWFYDDAFGEGNDDLHNGNWCPVTIDTGVSNRCLIFAPLLTFREGDARTQKTYSVVVGFQNRFADYGGSKHSISVRVAWRPK
ncbi:MAG TPA: hypothetical protein VK486_13810 [Thermoleophilaceae bacterium]|nr:hypothetical protein [Thermoleophilaceae bacterium]